MVFAQSPAQYASSLSSTTCPLTSSPAPLLSPPTRPPHHPLSPALLPCSVSVVPLLGIAFYSTWAVTVSEYCNEGSLYDSNKRLSRLLSTSPSDVRSPDIRTKAAPAFEKDSAAIRNGIRNGAAGALRRHASAAVAETRPEFLLAAWASGVASAINYLHSLAPDPVVHRNLKSTNCMLSGECMQAHASASPCIM